VVQGILKGIYFEQIWGCVKAELGYEIGLNWGSIIGADWGLFERECEGGDKGFGWENLRQILEHSRFKFKGHKKSYFKLVNTIAKTLSMKPHGNGKN